MAISLVGTIGAASQGASGAAVTPAWGTGENRTAGNLLACFVAVTGTATLPTTPSGWSIGAQKAGTSCSATVYHKIAAGTDAAPTIAAITSGVIAAQLAEYSGNSAAPFDDSGTASGTSSPVTATFTAADNGSPDLLLAAGADFRSASRTPSDTWTSNHVTSMTQAGSNNGTSSANHYSFGYGTTNSQSGADTAVMTCSSTQSITGLAVAAVSFLPPYTASGAVAEPSANSASGGQTFSGSGTIAEPSSNAATGALVFSGSGDAAITSASSGSGSLSTGFTGTGAVAVGSTNAAAGALTFAGSGAVVISAASSGSGTAGASSFSGTGAVAVGSSSAATGAQTFAGSGAISVLVAIAGSAATGAGWPIGTIAALLPSTWGTASVAVADSSATVTGSTWGSAEVTVL